MKCKNTLAARMVRETREAELADIELTARDFDSMSRIGLATVIFDAASAVRRKGTGPLAHVDRSGACFDRALDDATHMTDDARERSYGERG